MRRQCGYVLVLLLIGFLMGISFSAVGEPETTVVTETTDITITPLVNQINVAEQASFKVHIANTAAQKQRYTIYSLQSGQGWEVHPSPLRDRVIEVEGGKSYDALVVVRTLESLSPGIYNVQITIESDFGQRYAESLKVYLGPENPADYLPAIKVVADLNEKVDPRQPVSLRLFLENRNPLNLSDLRIRLESDIPEFRRETVVDLAPLGQKTVELSLTPNPHQQPKEYILFIVLERGGQTIKVVERKVEILPQELAFEVEIQPGKAFLQTIYTVKVHNDGNILNEQKVRMPVSFWEVLFSSARNEQVEVEDGQRYIVWQALLAPDGQASFAFLVNYRLLLYAGIIVLGFILFYLWARSPLEITKKAVVVHQEGGAISELKVMLELRNASQRPFKHVTIIDYMPGIAQVEGTVDIGTLKPLEVKHTPQGTKVVWSLNELEPLEHRLVTYKVRAKFNIVGTFNLPRAVVEYHKWGRKVWKAYSNLFQLEK